MLPRRPAGLSGAATAGLPTVALRVPAHPLAQRLLAAFGGPLAPPLRQSLGRVSPTTAAHVLDGLGGRIAAVLDGGPCPVGLESTILGFEGGAPVLLRPGGLPVEAIAEALGRALAAPAAAGVTAPGQLASHYAPRAPLRLDAAAPARTRSGSASAPATPPASTSRPPATSPRPPPTSSPACASRRARRPHAAPPRSPSPRSRARASAPRSTTACARRRAARDGHRSSYALRLTLK